MSEKEFVFEKGKIEYLQLIQEPICRMSTISGLFKGFAATIVSGISLISYNTTSWFVVGLSFLPVFVFAFLDVYYLHMERKYRELYKRVCSGEHAVNFEISTRGIKTPKTSIRSCLTSPSILLFYPMMLIILILVFALKVTNVIT